ncbi:MAG: hypothetical protein U0175_01940 [Caldilineaceae bacterium]
MRRTLQWAILFVLLFPPLLNALPLYAGAIPVGGNVTITDAGLNGARVETPDIVVRGNQVYAVWGDSRDEDTSGAFQSVYFAKSNDGGKSWGSNVRVNDLEYDDWCDHPQIAVAADGTIWIVWYLFYMPGSNQTNELRIAKSTDDGKTFTIKTVVDGFPGAEDRWRPALAVDESTSNLLLLYNEYWENNSSIGYDIYLHVFNAQLQKLSETTINDQPRSGKLGEGTQDNAVPLKSLVARNGLICAAWEDQRQRYTIHGACSSDGGKTFGANFPISEADGLNPHLALGADGKLYASYVVNSDSRKNVMLRVSSNQGGSWSTPINATQLTNSDEVTSHDLQVDDNGQLLVAWIDKVGFSVSNLYLSTSIDQGQNWATLPIEDGTGKYPSAAQQWNVALAVAGSGINTVAQLIWGDDRNSTSAIFGQPLQLDSIPPTAPANLKATGGDRSNLLTWGASSDVTGIQGYRVYRSASADGTFSEISPRLVTATSYRDVELDATPYFYRVVAVDGTANTGPASNAASATATLKSDLPQSGTIAYESNNQIRLRDFANFGVERVLAEGHRPRFAVDGQSLYYEANESIFVQPQSGGTVQPVYSAKGLFDDYDLSNYDPTTPSNNEKYLATIIGRGFASIGPVTFCYVSEPYYFVSGQQRFKDEYNYSSEIAISSYPQWMVYRYTGFCNTVAVGSSTPGDLYIVNLANNTKTVLTGIDIRDSDFAPARADNRLVFAAPFSGQYEIWKAEVDESGHLRNYVQLTRGATGILSRSPTWSTDGNWIIFQRDIDPGQLEDLRLFIVRADGAGLRALDVMGTRPAWSGGGAVDVPGDLGEKIYLPVVTR